MNTWKLSTLAITLAIAAFLWFRFAAIPTNSGDLPTEIQSGTTENGSQNAPKPGTSSTRNSNERPPGDAKPGGPKNGGRRSRPPALVVAQPVTDALINDRLKAVGSGTAVASVSVVPLSGGILTDVLVSSGEQVEHGTVLARLDDEEQVIARDRAARTAKDAAIDEARLSKLFRSRTSTEVELNNSRAVLADAELALREAQLTLSRRTVTAPISGVVGLVTMDPGNYVAPQTELITIDDRTTIIVEFWVPERFANQILVGQAVQATALANPGVAFQGTISGIGSRIETSSRTLPVQARIDNTSDTLRPGMSFELQLNFSGQHFPAVDPLAIQWDSKGSYVWRVADNKVERVPVQIIQRNPESVLVNSELTTVDLVVTEGLLALRNGATVRIQGTAP